MAVRALVQLFDSERSRGKWPDTRWQRPHPWKTGRSSEQRLRQPTKRPIQKVLPQADGLGPQQRTGLEKGLAATSPTRSSSRWAVPCAAQEMPSCRSHPSTPWVPAGGMEKRQPRWSNPRGPLRGGPERSARDPQRNPRGGLCGGPKGQQRKHRRRSKTPQSRRPTGEREKTMRRHKRPKTHYRHGG